MRSTSLRCCTIFGGVASKHLHHPASRNDPRICGVHKQILHARLYQNSVSFAGPSGKSQTWGDFICLCISLSRPSRSLCALPARLTLRNVYIFNQHTSRKSRPLSPKGANYCQHSQLLYKLAFNVTVRLLAGLTESLRDSSARPQ